LNNGDSFELRRRADYRPVPSNCQDLVKPFGCSACLISFLSGFGSSATIRAVWQYSGNVKQLQQTNQDSAEGESNMKDRRGFLKAAGAGVLSAAAYRNVLGANEGVRVGFIGIGLIGKRHLRRCAAYAKQTLKL
jgi:hypothetical protein